MPLSQEPNLSLDVVLSENARPVPLTNDEAKALITTLNPLVPCVTSVKAQAENLTVRNQVDAANADNICAEIRSRIKTVQAAIKPFKDEAKRRHSMWCDLEALFVEPFTAAGKSIKTKRDDWTAEEQRKAEIERARLQAIADEKARKEREAQEAIARAAREKELAAQRAAEEARRQAEQASAEERKALLAEAARKEREAAAAAAKAQEREERAAAVTTTVINVAAPASRKGARTVWKVKSYDMTAMGIPVGVQGFVEVKTTNLERMKAANSLYECPGVVFHQVTI